MTLVGLSVRDPPLHTPFLRGPTDMLASSSIFVKCEEVRYFYILCLKEVAQTVLVSGLQHLNLNLKLVSQGFVFGFVLLTHEFLVTHHTREMTQSLCRPKDPIIASSLSVEKGLAKTGSENISVSRPTLPHHREGISRKL